MKKSKTSKSSKSSTVSDSSKPKKSTSKEADNTDLGEVCFEVDPATIKSAVDTLIKCSVYGGGGGNFGDDGSGSTLDSLLVEVEGSSIKLTYSKLAVFGTTTCDAKVLKSGSFVIAPALFTTMKFPGKSLRVTLKKSKVLFASGAVRGDLQTAGSAEDVLAAKPETMKCNIIFEKAVFEKTVLRVLYNSFDTSLPSYGLPLHISSKDGRVRLVTCDSICAAMLKQKQKKFPDIDVVFPGNALLHIVKSLKGATEVKIGVSESMFRIVGGNFSIYHPIGVYEMIDVEGFLKEEVSDDKFEMTAKMDVESFVKAMSSALDINKLAKSNNVVEVNFAKGVITYRNDVSNVDVQFPVLEHNGSGKYMTDGQKLVAFISTMKIEGSCTMRVYDGRIFIYTEDEKLVYIMPLQ